MQNTKPQIHTFSENSQSSSLQKFDLFTQASFSEQSNSTRSNLLSRKKEHQSVLNLFELGKISKNYEEDEEEATPYFIHASDRIHLKDKEKLDNSLDINTTVDGKQLMKRSLLTPKGFHNEMEEVDVPPMKISSKTNNIMFFITLMMQVVLILGLMSPSSKI